MRRAHPRAQAILRKLFNQPAHQSWSEARRLLRKHLEAANLREGSIASYLSALNLLHTACPVHGPADITPEMAEEFKVRRSIVVSPRTLRSNLQHLSVIFGFWFVDKCRIVGSNPFATVDAPHEDTKKPALIDHKRLLAFFNWLEDRWDGWRLPILLLGVQRGIGCRISELASIAPSQLREGRICFVAETTKGRRERLCKVPPKMYAEMEEISGRDYVFENFADELRAIHIGRGLDQNAKRIRDFTPGRFRLWIEEQHRLYFVQTGVDHFKLHTATRGAAMSQARMNGVIEGDAAKYFGCNPVTMHKYYLSLNEKEISDGVYEKMYEKMNGEN